MIFGQRFKSTRGTQLIGALSAGAVSLGLLLVSPAQASIFFPVGYDNIANTVTSGPTANNLQTTGNYRDIWWASLNNNLPRVGSPDYINYGKNLVQVANHAEDNGTGLYDALNFTGPTINGRQNYLAIFDSTPADGTTTQDTFALGANQQNPLTIIADFMFAGPGHNVSAGIVASTAMATMASHCLRIMSPEIIRAQMITLLCPLSIRILWVRRREIIRPLRRSTLRITWISTVF